MVIRNWTGDSAIRAANVRFWLKADSFDIERLGRKRVRFNLEIQTFLRFLRGFDLKDGRLRHVIGFGYYWMVSHLD